MPPIRSCSAPTRWSASPAARSRRRSAGLRSGRWSSPVSSPPRRLGALSELIEVLVGRSDVAPDRRDKRFVHPAWTANPIYRRLVQAYLVETQALLDVGRRGGAGRQEPGAGPVRDDAAHRGRRADQHAARQPERAGQGRRDPWSQPAQRRTAHGPRRPPQRRHAVDRRHPALHRRRQPGRHPGRGGAPRRGVRADPVRAGRSRRLRPAPRGDPAADQQVLHLRSRPGPQPRRAHGRRRGPVLRDELAQPDRRPARLEPRHLRRRVQGSDRGGVRDHRKSRCERCRDVRRRDHDGVPSRPPRRDR